MMLKTLIHDRATAREDTQFLMNTRKHVNLMDSVVMDADRRCNTPDPGANEDEKRYALSRKLINHENEFTLEHKTQHFRKLGYGMQLADLIRQCAREKWNWNVRPGISLVEAQCLLLKSRDAIFTMTGNRYIRPGEHFLIINSGKLVVAESTRSITHSFMVGFGAKVLGAGPSLGYSRLSKKADVIVQQDVWSVLDAIELITGKRDDNFKKFRDGQATFLTPLQMEEFLGSLLFVLFLLGDKVKANGRFKKCLVDNKSGTKNGQI